MNIPLWHSITVGVFLLISTKFEVVIAIASSCRFKCRSHNGWSCVCPFGGKYKMIIVSRTSHISYKRVSTEY